MQLKEDFELADLLVTLLEFYRQRAEEYLGDPTVNELTMHMSIAEGAARRWRLEAASRASLINLDDIATAGALPDDPLIDRDCPIEAEG